MRILALSQGEVAVPMGLSPLFSARGPRQRPGQRGSFEAVSAAPCGDAVTCLAEKIQPAPSPPNRCTPQRR